MSRTGFDYKKALRCESCGGVTEHEICGGMNVTVTKCLECRREVRYVQTVIAEIASAGRTRGQGEFAFMKDPSFDRRAPVPRCHLPFFG